MYWLTNFKQIIGWIIIAVAAVLPCPWTASAESARDLVISGNSAYEAGEYGKALVEYEKAGVKDPESAHVDFNKGNVYYQQGDFDSAMSAYQQVSVKNAEPALTAGSRFNMGNTAFRKAEQERATDLEKALSGYQAGINYYKDALKLDPNLSDAAHNIEVSRLNISQVMEEIKKQEDRQKAQEQAKKEMSEALKKLIREQEQMAGESKDQAEKQDQNQEEDRRKGRKQALKQQDVQEKTEGLADKMDSGSGQEDQKDGQPHSTMEEAKKHVSSAVQKQKEAGNSLLKQDFKKAGDSQEKAADELKKALKSLNDKNSKSGPKKDQDQAKHGDKEKDSEKEQEKEKQEQKKGEQEQSSSGTPEQGDEDEPVPELEVPPPDRTARDLLNEEKENRKLRRIESTHGLRPVEKDW
ncbi:MAG: tetratricopeptide repeat protein [Thermodesulfobacteriota bacterium]|nr:tetratricopeptide repeat protein [Thermodesulfobacteriota bacterium]